MSEQPHISVQLLSNPAYLSGARELVAAVARRMSFGDEGAGQIALAVDEALCNVIRHGYGQKSDGQIWIQLWPLDDAGKGKGIKIVIEDEANQIDPCQIKGRDLDQVRPGGLGVHIIREVMDDVAYEKRDGHGMRLTMTKRVNSVSRTASTPVTPRGCGCGE